MTTWTCPKCTPKQFCERCNKRLKNTPLLPLGETRLLEEAEAAERYTRYYRDQGK